MAGPGTQRDLVAADATKPAAAVPAEFDEGVYMAVRAALAGRVAPQLLEPLSQLAATDPDALEEIVQRLKDAGAAAKAGESYETTIPLRTPQAAAAAFGLVRACDTWVRWRRRGAVHGHERRVRPAARPRGRRERPTSRSTRAGPGSSDPDLGDEPPGHRPPFHGGAVA
jgi:hypothetical protein